MNTARYDGPLSRLEQRIKKKEQQAKEAKEKGMHSTFRNIMAELVELKREERKMHMGSR